MTRRLPDVELLVGDILTDIAWSPRLPEDVASKLPRRTVRKIGGTWTHPLFLDKPHVVIDTYAATDALAESLAEDARNKLIDAWLSQHRYAHGVLNKLVEVISPFVVRTGTEPDGVARVSSTYEIHTRP